MPPTRTTLPAGVANTSIEITVMYPRPVTSTSGPLLGVGPVTMPGHRVVFADREVPGDQAKVVAPASSILLVFPLAEA